MDDLDEASKELMSAAISLEFENGASAWKAYAHQFNAKLEGTEPQNIFLVEQIKILSQAPMSDPINFNTKKFLFEEKLKKKKRRQREIQNELLSMTPLVFIDPIIFKNGE
ncbi:hypothetical protein ACO0K0_03885 [Undibacterium sp. SXout11W]|uniref:hypothetical protein n=1 Tax=Undibacterium sp. SXout11W TaxID=3413050 RepID=UPI003BF0F255